MGVGVRQSRRALEQLAELAGLSKSYLWELESRESQRPSAEKLTALADALGVAASYFFEEDVRAPQERHLDEAIFRGYQKLEPEAKEQLRKILGTFKTAAKAGAFFRRRNNVIPVPNGALAAPNDLSIAAITTWGR